MLEECGLPFQLKAVNMGGGEQFTEAFLRISLPMAMLSMVDNELGLSVFELGAITILFAD